MRARGAAARRATWPCCWGCPEQVPVRVCFGVGVCMCVCVCVCVCVFIVEKGRKNAKKEKKMCVYVCVCVCVFNTLKSNLHSSHTKFEYGFSKVPLLHIDPSRCAQAQQRSCEIQLC